MRFNVLSDGPFRYIHSTENGQLLLTLSKQPGGKFVEYEDEDAPVAMTMRQWKARLCKSVDRRDFDTSRL